MRKMIALSLNYPAMLVVTPQVAVTLLEQSRVVKRHGYGADAKFVVDKDPQYVPQLTVIYDTQVVEELEELVDDEDEEEEETNQLPTPEPFDPL